MQCSQTSVRPKPFDTFCRPKPNRRHSAGLAKGNFKTLMPVAAQVAERENTARRILLRSVRYGRKTQPAFSVRGSSRRIMTMRFRPADIRLINRRKMPLVPSPALRLHLLLKSPKGGEND